MRTPLPEGGCHQCWTSPSTNCRAAARSRCSRATSAPRDHERHHVLELVAEAVGAAGLIEGGAGPDPAGERLVEQPPVQHQVHGAVRRLHLDGAERVVPLGRDVLQGERDIRGAMADHERARSLQGVALAEQEDDLVPAAGGQLDHHLERRARVEPGADPPGRRGPALQHRGMVERAVAADELRAIGRPRGLAAAEIGERDAAREVGVPGVAGEERPGGGVDLGDDGRRVRAARGAQHPLDVGGDREAPRLAGPVLDRQPRDLDRILGRDELQELQRDAARGVLEAAVALPVPGDVGGRVLPDRQKRGPPQLRRSPRRGRRTPRPAGRSPRRWTTA